MDSQRIWAILILAIVGILLFSPGTGSAAKNQITIAVGQEPTSMDHSLASAGPDGVVLENWGEYLISRVPSGELKPGLASSW